MVHFHTTQPRSFGTKRQNKETKKETKEVPYVFCLLTLCGEHKLTALNSEFCNLNNIQAIVSELCNLSQNLSYLLLKSLLYQLSRHVTESFYARKFHQMNVFFLILKSVEIRVWIFWWSYSKIFAVLVFFLRLLNQFGTQDGGPFENYVTSLRRYELGHD